MALLRALADPTRVRLLCALEHEELTVAELQEVLDVAQSRVSTHLGRLKKAGLALDRVDGPHRYYRLADGSMPVAARIAWQAVRQPLGGDAQVERDRQRLESVIASRQNGGSSWVDRVAGSLDRHYSPGRTWESLARGARPDRRSRRRRRSRRGRRRHRRAAGAGGAIASWAWTSMSAWWRRDRSG